MTTPFNPRTGRQRHLSAFLQAATYAVFAAALVGVLVPGEVGESVAVVMVGLLIATPLIRNLWLALRWLHKGDLRFAALAVALLALVAVGALIGSR